MKRITTLSLSLATAYWTALPNATCNAEENLIFNGDFGSEHQIMDWEALKFSPQGPDGPDFAPAPEMVLWIPEGYDQSVGAIKVSIVHDAEFVYKANQAGARTLLRPTAKKGGALRVTFAAKSVSGSPFLYITRFTGGGNIERPIELGKSWKEYDVTFPISEDASLLVFNLVASENALESLQGPAPVTPDAVEGEFVIDNVKAFEIPAGDQ